MCNNKIVKANSSFLEHNFEGGKKEIGCYNNRLVSKVRKTQHHNPEFLVINKVRFFFKPENKYLSIKGGGWGVKLRKLSIFVVKRVSSCLSFSQSASTAAATHISTAPRTLY
jgi:hypothetical protein